MESFGVLGFAAAVMAYFGVALTAGFGDIGSREVARDPAAARRLASDATGIRLMMALVGTAATAAIAFAFVSNTLERTVLLVSTIGLFALALDTTWVYRGLSRNRTAASALLLAQLAYLAGVVAFVHAPDDVVKVPLIQFAGDLVAASMLLWLLFRGGVPKPDLAGGMRLLRQSGFITVSRLLRALIVTFDVLLLAVLVGNRDVGLYTAAYRVCLLVTTIAVATHVVFLPGVVRSATAGMESLSNVMTRSISLTSAVILPIVTGGMVLAGPLLEFLFGKPYGAAATAFALLLMSIGLLALYGTTHSAFVALHKTRQEAMIFAAGAALNIILNLILIPRYRLNGAASSTLAAEAFIFACVVVAFRGAGLRPATSRAILPLVASVAMAAVLFAASGRIHVLALIAIGAAVYLLTLAVTGGLKQVLSDAAAEHDPRSI